MMDPFSVLFVCLAFSKIVITSSASCGPTQLLHADLNYTQTLSSPSYNANGYYPALTTCNWAITAPLDKRIQLTFTAFDTYGYPTCGLSTDDTLKIYDGGYKPSMIGKYCGNYLPANVVSSGENLYLVFESKSRFSSLKKGFKLEYKAVNNPIDDRYICSPFNSEDQFYVQHFHKLASTTPKYIKSPLYPNKYPSNIECVWTIASFRKIKLTLKNVKIFNYKNDSSCSSGNDVLTVRDGEFTNSKKLLTICTPTSSSTTVISSGNSNFMKIRFKSNLDNYFIGSTAGFQAEYIEIDPSSTVPEWKWVLIGSIIGAIILIFLIVCCVRVVKKRRSQGYQRTPTVTTMQTTTAPYAPYATSGKLSTTTWWQLSTTRPGQLSTTR